MGVKIKFEKQKVYKGEKIADIQSKESKDIKINQLPTKI
jgi:hypothetical protein